MIRRISAESVVRISLQVMMVRHRSFHLTPRHMLEALRSAYNFHWLGQLAYFMDEMNPIERPALARATLRAFEVNALNKATREVIVGFE